MTTSSVYLQIASYSKLTLWRSNILDFQMSNRSCIHAQSKSYYIFIIAFLLFPAFFTETINSIRNISKFLMLLFCDND